MPTYTDAQYPRVPTHANMPSYMNNTHTHTCACTHTHIQTKMEKKSISGICHNNRKLPNKLVGKLGHPSCLLTWGWVGDVPACCMDLFLVMSGGTQYVWWVCGLCKSVGSFCIPRLTSVLGVGPASLGVESIKASPHALW